MHAMQHTPHHAPPSVTNASLSSTPLADAQRVAPSRDARTIQDRMASALAARRARGLLRTPRLCDAGSADFASNDYLGFARSAAFRAAVDDAMTRLSPLATGATGSRLLCGHSELHEMAERVAARHHGAKRALLFNSGYDANIALFACVPGPDDAVVHDALVHASVHDGVRMSRVKCVLSFAHNCSCSLREMLREAARRCKGAVLVAVESVYSMDGDVAPLGEILDVVVEERMRLGRDVAIVVDEAHAGGVYGKAGAGLAVDIARNSAVLARVVTMGKAFAAHGAFVLGGDTLLSYLVNYGRPLIYSTALPPHAVVTLLAAFAFAGTENAERARERLWRMRDLFRVMALDEIGEAVMKEGKDSAIQGVLIPGNKRCNMVSRFVRRKGFDVYPIRAPTVPRGAERLRIVIHAHNTEDEIKSLVSALKHALSLSKAAL